MFNSRQKSLKELEKLKDLQIEIFSDEVATLLNRGGSCLEKFYTKDELEKIKRGVNNSKKAILESGFNRGLKDKDSTQELTNKTLETISKKRKEREEINNHISGISGSETPFSRLISKISDITTKESKSDELSELKELKIEIIEKRREFQTVLSSLNSKQRCNSKEIEKLITIGVKLVELVKDDIDTVIESILS